MALIRIENSPFFYTRFMIRGKSIFESTKTDNKQEAREYEEKRKYEVRRESYLGIKQSIKWENACERWLKEKSNKKSINQDKVKIEYLNKFMSGKLIDQLDNNLIEEIITAKLKEGVTAATINRLSAFIKSLLRKAINEWQVLDKMPYIRMMKETVEKRQFLTKEQAHLLIKELPPHLACMSEFTLHTGLRQQNVAKLKWSQITDNIIIIPGSKFKNGKDFSIPLNSKALEILNKQKYTTPWSEFVFTYKGKPISQVSTKAWYKACKRAGLKDFRWHDLRHTWASWMLQSGASIAELKSLGGWESLSMVLHYSHFSSNILLNASEKMCNFVTS